MISIAICDDDKSLQNILRQKIEKHCAEHSVPCQISCYDSGEEVLGLPAAQTPDLLFLDIQMSGRNGMEIARELRKHHRDIILIFVTALSEYVYEAFDVSAFHYLVKPFEDAKLQAVLDNALQQYARQQEAATIRHTEKNAPTETESIPQYARTESVQAEAPRMILVKRAGVSTKVLLADIIYAEVFNRKVMLHTVNGDIEYYGKLAELSEQAGADFCRTHRAYLVNFKYVEKYSATTIWLEQGTALVSKKQFAGFVRQYMQYINRQTRR